MLEGVRDVYISSLSEQKDHHHAQSTMHSMSLFLTKTNPKIESKVRQDFSALA
jgi:hypothetical protein